MEDKLAFLWFFILLIATLQLTYSIKTYLLSMILIIAMFTVTVKITKIEDMKIRYIQYRDNNYTDFGDDKGYNRWLLDNRKRNIG